MCKYFGIYQLKVKKNNINDFFLNETHAQLQLSMFGFQQNLKNQIIEKLRNVL